MITFRSEGYSKVPTRSKKSSLIAQVRRSGAQNGNEDLLHVIAFKNSLLAALKPNVRARLLLRPVVFELHHEIQFPGQPIDNIFFVEEGMASMTTTFKDGSQVEVGMFGYESVIGISALMGAQRSLNRVYTQIAGHGYMCSVSTARKEFRFCGDFQTLSLRYVQSQLDQTTQSVGCNARHNAEQRLAGWLLLCADRARSHTFSMSHESLADMLGSSRPTMSIAANALRQDNLIDYSRGAIEILDAKGLEGRACECYRIIKEHLEPYPRLEVMESMNCLPRARFG